MKERIRIGSILLGLVVLLSLGTAQLAYGQGGSGELTGLVTDPAGAVIPKLPVTLSNTATGLVRTTLTTDGGIYRFPDLPIVGTYTLKVSAKNFRTFEAANIVITVGRIVTVDVRLELGSASEVVEVQEGAQLVSTTESQVGDLLNEKVWQTLPLEERTQNAFIYTLAGANPDAGTGRGAAVDGARSGTGNFLVEGYDNNEQGQGGRGSISGGFGGANTSISPDAIEEYRVIEHSLPAEYGKAGGFTTDTVLKSGTDKFHGALFEYNRIQALAANNWFSNASGETDHLVRNQFGGAVGGPIIKDRTFFFFTTEAHRLRQSTPVSAVSTTQDFLNFVNSGQFETFMETNPNGICMQLAGGACPGAFSSSAALGPNFQKLYAAEPFPLATRDLTQCGAGLFTGAGNGYANTLQCPQGNSITYPVPVYGFVTEPQPTITNEIRYTAKIDHKLSDKHQLSGAFLYDNSDSDTKFAGSDSTIGVDEPTHGRTMNAGITWTWTLSPTITNQARMGYVRHTLDFPGDPAANAQGVPSIFTFVDPLGVAFGNSSALPQFFTENDFVYRDDVSFTKGKHSFKTGFVYDRTRNGSAFEELLNGLFAPYDVESLVTDMTFGDQTDQLFFGKPAYGSWYYAEASVNPATGARPNYYRGYRANEYGTYFQDDWRMTKTLSWNLGLRWDYFGPPHNYLPGLDSNFYWGSYTTPIPGTGNPFFPTDEPYFNRVANGSLQQKNSDIWNKDYKNFAPRIGFAWDTFGTSKFVVRGGYGIGYDRMYNNVFENIRFNPPAFCSCSFGTFVNGVPGGNLETPGVYTVPFTSTSAFVNPAILPVLPKSTPRHIDQNLKAAYYEQANLGFQYGLGKDLILETNYIGTFGKRLLGLINDDTFDGRTACLTSGAPYAVTTPCGAAGFVNGFSSARPNPTLAGDTLRTNAFSSIYHGLQVVLRKRWTNGLQFNANYTYSKGLDQLSDVFVAKGGQEYPTDNQNIWSDYGPSDFNLKHRAVGSFTYELPFFKQNRWLGGWSTSGIITLQTGSPFSVFDSAHDTNHDGLLTDRVSYQGQTYTGKGSPANGFLVASPSVFFDTVCPPTVNMGLWCNGGSGRNAFVGPGFKNVDFGAAKSFAISERAKVTFQANFFNLLNHPSFATPDANINDMASTFGKSLSTVSNSRVTQLALRFDF